MLLSELRDYVQEHERAALSDLMVRFEASPDVLRDILAHLIRKGRVQAVDGPKCDSCCKCAAETLEIYEWIG
ncbi:FeoC-like transcriptional regulator [Magnetovibrio sp. PR-2]|uniref:FeoC-like transcriptional regulator n=1 Tax=Magnetovibrio sp. PR-2 TaxID=3120356 RepID=UPI002FCE2846